MDKTKTFYRVSGTPYRLTDPGHFRHFLDESGDETTFRQVLRRYVSEHPNKVVEVNEDGSPVS
jgi:hypothetical protein